MPDHPHDHVVITAREIYDAVIGLTERVNVLISQHDGTMGEVGDHEARLRALERGRWPLPSLAVLVSLAALVISFFT